MPVGEGVRGGAELFPPAFGQSHSIISYYKNQGISNDARVEMHMLAALQSTGFNGTCAC
jgi:hypothetical protein